MLLFAALLPLSRARAEGTTMDDKLHREIAEAVHSEYGWKLEEVAIDEIERLRRSACSFYTARSTVRPLSYQPNYAVLHGTEIVGVTTGNALENILDACGADASADWRAEIITRFHPDIGGGLVLSNESTRPDIVRKLAQAGKIFTPPAFVNGRQTVTYLLLDPEAYIVYSVRATRTTAGPVEVVKTTLFGKTVKSNGP